ncbi:MAG: Bax inhibitor-1/YccA family protein [Clostridium sp.]|nr:Bax inhibitor-1/YccA family protein [Clostridium sp.]
MNEEMMNRSYEVQVEGESLGRYTAKTFGWMFLGLLVTFAVAVGGYRADLVFYLSNIPYWYYALVVAELGVVIYLSARIEKMSVAMARTMFFLYAVINGVFFSAYLYIFDLTILWMVFGVTSVFFGIMAAIGWFGNINFAKLRPFLMGGLVFLFFFWILAMFIDLSAFETTVCTVGIFVFLLLTAYDVKKIQAYYVYYGQMPEMAAKASIFSALQLYLDFINLFLYILRILGRKK